MEGGTEEGDDIEEISPLALDRSQGSVSGLERGGHFDFAIAFMLLKTWKLLLWEHTSFAFCEEHPHVYSITRPYLLSVCFCLGWLSWLISSSSEDARSFRHSVQSLHAFDLGHHPVQLDSVNFGKLASFSSLQCFF